MRKSGLLVLALLLAAPSLFAQEKNNFSVFASSLEFSNSSAGRRLNAAYGLSFERMFTPHLSAEISVSSESHHSYGYVVDETGYINQVSAVSFRTHPIDLIARYRFVNESRWRPFLGLGMRYAAAPHVDSMFGYRNRWTPEADGGVVYQMRHLGIVIDGKALLGDHEYYDSVLKTSIGLSWRF
jgi:outer membrane protein W